MKKRERVFLAFAKRLAGPLDIEFSGGRGRGYRLRLRQFGELLVDLEARSLDTLQYALARDIVRLRRSGMIAADRRRIAA